MWHRAGLTFPKECARPKRNDRIVRPATMDVSNKESAVAQGLDSSAFERAAVVFAISFLAATSVSPAWDCMRVLRVLDKEWGL
jgi:hypothetical protein